MAMEKGFGAVVGDEPNAARVLAPAETRQQHPQQPTQPPPSPAKTTSTSRPSTSASSQHITEALDVMKFPFTVLLLCSEPSLDEMVAI
ncbi:hypothetical protein CLCR_07813 [Cladophialophora carrionii]|uniref:Uncharacterized protein n=1 Tax=Cladophialophora carrionii TaxID=86049 RepID=A0A1C1CNC3_9EURO|nr:hypothetical protein CLCR_07813 [Cladophialophora carrionii]